MLNNIILNLLIHKNNNYHMPERTFIKFWLKEKKIIKFWLKLKILRKFSQQ
jgi:hypothetical protein